MSRSVGNAFPWDFDPFATGSGPASPLGDVYELEGRIAPGFFKHLSHVFHKVEHAAVKVVHQAEHAAVKVVKEAAHTAAAVAKKALPLAEDYAATVLTGGNPVLGHALASGLREYASGQHDIKKIFEHQAHAVVKDAAHSLVNTAAGVAIGAAIKALPSPVTGAVQNAGSLFGGVRLPADVQKALGQLASVPGGSGSVAAHTNSPAGQLIPAAYHPNGLTEGEQKLNAVAKLANDTQYQPKGGVTHCNEFARDFAETVTNRTLPALKGTANDQAAQLARSADWTHIGAGNNQLALTLAQTYANEGRVVVASWANPGGHGHIAVIVPARPGDANLVASGWTAPGAKAGTVQHLKVPHAAQAGDENFTYKSLSNSFGAAKAGAVQLYVLGSPGLGI